MLTLYCTVCLSEVPEGFSQCVACRAGYTSQLACSRCRRPVRRGEATCGCDCPLAVTQVSPPAALAAPAVVSGFVAPRAAPPVLPGLPAHVTVSSVPEVYSAGRYGVEATVTMPGRDVEIMNEIGQLVVVLHAVASHMNEFRGISDHTRAVIRAMRGLAADLQDEVETRRGPTG